jgi:hypothetical protein
MTNLKRLEKEFILPYLKKSDEQVNKVYQVFQDYFGKDKVDLQMNYKYGASDEAALVKRNTDDDRAVLARKSLFHNRGPANFNFNVRDCSVSRFDSLSSSLVEKYFEEFLKLDKDTINAKIELTMRDLPLYAIIVHFPTVVIRNEHDKTHETSHFYIKIELLSSGKMYSGFLVKRSHFTKNELEVGYMHSHCPSGSCNPTQMWSHSCLGSGPIQRTEARLNSNCDLDMWMLFCNELERYIQVESLDGGPYIRMSSIPETTSTGNSLYNYQNAKDVKADTNKSLYRGMRNDIYPRLIKPFIEQYVASFNLPFRRVDNVIKPAFTYDEFLINISQALITYLNGLPINQVDVSYIKDNILVEAAMVNEVINLVNQNRSNRNNWRSYERYIGYEIGVFHGEPITFQIVDNVQVQERNNHFRILHPKYALPILQLIIDLLNSEYGRNTQTNQTRLYI